MSEAATLTLAAITVLLVKHTIADFFLQNAYQHRNKGRYGHPGGLLHAFIHVGLTTPVFLVITPSQTLAGVILAGEFVIHYHIDWTKENVTAWNGWTPAQAAFWRALGVDQLMHGLTYVAIVWVLLAIP